MRYHIRYHGYIIVWLYFVLLKIISEVNPLKLSDYNCLIVSVVLELKIKAQFRDPRKCQLNPDITIVTAFSCYTLSRVCMYCNLHIL